MTILVSKQHFEGRLYKVRELIEVGAFANGYLSAPEYRGDVPMRYPRSWKARTIIQMSRQTETVGGLAYGPDWCGEQKYRIDRISLSPEQRKESTYPPEYFGDAHTFEFLYRPAPPSRTSHPLKSVVEDYLLRAKIPFKLLRVLTDKIRQRDENVWVACSTQKELGRLMEESLPIAAE